MACMVLSILLPHHYSHRFHPSYRMPVMYGIHVLSHVEGFNKHCWECAVIDRMAMLWIAVGDGQQTVCNNSRGPSWVHCKYPGQKNTLHAWKQSVIVWTLPIQLLTWDIKWDIATQGDMRYHYFLFEQFIMYTLQLL